MKEPGHIRHAIWGIDEIFYLLSDVFLLEVISLTTESKSAEYDYEQKRKGINHFVSVNEDTVYFSLISFPYNSNEKHYEILFSCVCVCAGRGCEGRRKTS